MKKIALIFACLLIAGCGKTSVSTKTESKITDNSLIIGKWTIVKDSSNFYYYNSAQNYHQIYNYDGTYFLQFNADGTGNNSNYQTFTYTLKNNVLTFYDHAYTNANGNFPADTDVVKVNTIGEHSLNIYFDWIVTDPGSTERENNIYEYLKR